MKIFPAKLIVSLIGLLAYKNVYSVVDPTGRAIKHNQHSPTFK